jgi:TatD DNase family protein
MLVDSHCHLDFPDFADDLEGTLARAQAAGVGLMLSIGTRLDRFGEVLAIAERYENVYCTVGVHPHEAGRDPAAEVGRLVDLARHPKVVGFGETGLDYYYDHSPRDRQRGSFHIHIEAARQAALPVVVHTRDADDDTIRILTDEMAEGPFTGLIHCFSSSRQLAENAVDLGLYISLSGVLTFNKADELRRIVGDLPMDRLLVETDAPYLAPVPKRGKVNEPAFVAHTAAMLARVKALPVAQVADQTTANFLRLFTKVTPCG